MNTFTFTFSLRDTQRATELLHDNPYFRNNFAWHSSNRCETTDEDEAFELQSQLTLRGLEFELSQE